MNLKRQLSSNLFRLARSPISGTFIGFSFAYLHRLMPVNRLLETGRTLAFVHPVKVYDFHALAVPKMVKSAFLAFNFGSEEERLAIIDIFQVCRQAAALNQLPHFSIIVNGGEYQDVPQVHFHIASNQADLEKVPLELEPESSDFERISIFRPTNSHRSYHQVLRHTNLDSPFNDLNFQDSVAQSALVETFSAAQQLMEQAKFRAFSVLVNVRLDQPRPFSLEIVSDHL